MITAFVLSGGGALGAVQVGMLRALTERRIVPDLLVGTSAGALNAAYLAGRGIDGRALADLESVWARIRRRDVFPVDVLRQSRALIGARPSLFADTGLRRLIATQVRSSRVEATVIPLHLVATDLLSGTEVLMSDGHMVTALLASTAIPGLLPPVHREGRILVDGGLADNTPISQAIALGADRIFVLPAGVPCALETPPTGPLAVGVHALGFLTQQRLIDDIVRYASQAELCVLPPLCPLGVSTIDFGHAPELARRARVTSGEWLDGGRVNESHPERFLALHTHSRAGAVERVEHPIEERL